MVKSYCVKQKTQTECVSGSEKYVKTKKIKGLCLNANALNVV